MIAPSGRFKVEIVCPVFIYKVVKGQPSHHSDVKARLLLTSKLVNPQDERTNSFKAVQEDTSRSAKEKQLKQFIIFNDVHPEMSKLDRPPL